jgi:hypothetical protein
LTCDNADELLTEGFVEGGTISIAPGITVDCGAGETGCGVTSRSSPTIGMQTLPSLEQ